MQFELNLSLGNELHARAYDPELDDIRSILADVCDFAEGKGKFMVSGFGQDPWAVDVRTDLLVLLEQLPGALVAIASGARFEIYFYEQGIERKIGFAPAQESYIAECLSYSKWQPNPAVETMDRTSLVRMLTAVRDEFMRFMSSCCPDLVMHPWVQSWLQCAAGA